MRQQLICAVDTLLRSCNRIIFCSSPDHIVFECLDMTTIKITFSGSLFYHWVTQIRISSRRQKGAAAAARDSYRLPAQWFILLKHWEHTFPPVTYVLRCVYVSVFFYMCVFLVYCFTVWMALPDLFLSWRYIFRTSEDCLRLSEVYGGCRNVRGEWQFWCERHWEMQMGEDYVISSSNTITMIS